MFRIRSRHLAGYWLFFLLLAHGLLRSQNRPNFIFILTDDQSYGMMGCTGNPLVQTPNLDNLAAESTLFTNAHVTSAICTPSRASMLTGQFERQHGINFNSGTSMSEKGWANTYPMVMRKAGYYTGWIGKNHVPIGEGGYDSGLMESSFDYWYAGHGHLRFYPKEVHHIFNKAQADTQTEIIGEGVQDFLSNGQKLVGAVKFIRKRPLNQPFMLSINFNLPHGAGTSTMEMRETDDEIYRDLYRNRKIPLPAHYVARADIVKPKLPLSLHHVGDRQASYDWVNTPDRFQERTIRQMQAMTGIDRLVGQLRQTLREHGLHRNTVIVFTSDHGLFSGQFGLGGKALCYEITTHVPLIIHIPRSVKKSEGNSSSALVQTIDIAPTLLDLAGIAIPSTYQGKSLMPLLNSEKKQVRNYVYTENLWSTSFGNPRCEAVQNHEWKYIRYYRNDNPSARQQIETARAMGIPLKNVLYKVYDKQLAQYRSFVEGPLSGEPAVYEELYHLAKDPDETQNLAYDPLHEERVQKMREVWKREIDYARGTSSPEILRYTADSEAERGAIIDPK